MAQLYKLLRRKISPCSEGGASIIRTIPRISTCMAQPAKSLKSGMMRGTLKEFCFGVVELAVQACHLPSETGGIRVPHLLLLLVLPSSNESKWASNKNKFVMLLLWILIRFVVGRLFAFVGSFVCFCWFFIAFVGSLFAFVAGWICCYGWQFWATVQ